MKSYYILKPKNLNLEYLANKYPPEFNFNLDFTYLIVHFVIMYQSNKSNTNYVRLSSKYLQKYNRIYNKHIRFLLDNYPNDGAVLRGTRYDKGKPYGYKLPKHYFNNELDIYEIKDVNLLKKINNFLLINTTNEQIRLHYYFLHKHFKNNKLTVYEPFQAIDEINNLKEEKRLRNAKNLIAIMNNQYKCTLKPNTDGRVHSNITRLSKISRKYLQYEGEFLGEVDISSAVPYFLFITMSYYLNNNLSYISNEFQYNNTITYMLAEIKGDLAKSDVDSFGKSVLNKELYNQFTNQIFKKELYTSKGKDFTKVMKYYNHAFKEHFGYHFDGDIEDLKKFSKKRLLSMIFAKANSYTFEQIAFGSMFPKVLKFINEFKNACLNKEDIKIKLEHSQRHKKLSYFCFQFEAKIMIDKIARAFDKYHKGKVPIFTLHDCLITRVSHLEELKDFMEMKFVELLDIAPNLTIEKSLLHDSYLEAV
ncbi:hypothetical protein [Flavobacterium sp. 2]|uniref:hypothetical protein n=1 Tax=Flavobacterium sp. 2 TaxID=308053 RepID=UPI000C4EA515|nr:hypothetical protein [Flavobacterium sp. 2]PIF69460.1 hypothetical protein CLU99_0165 [Flavobacterium sp. 2]